MLGVQFIDVLACEGRYSFAFLKKFACKLSRRVEVLLSDHVLGRAFELGQRLLFKHCIVIAYAVSCCLLPMQTPYYL